MLNLFYIPGCMTGAFIVDRVGPKRQMISFLLLQAFVGFLMSGFYVQLATPANVAAFTVVCTFFALFNAFFILRPLVLRHLCLTHWAHTPMV